MAGSARLPRIDYWLFGGVVALALLGLPAIALTRTKEQAFRDRGLSKDADDATLVAALAATPKLIERPVVFANGKAALGRPPEAALDIL